MRVRSLKLSGKRGLIRRACSRRLSWIFFNPRDKNKKSNSKSTTCNRTRNSWKYSLRV
jgi:hypothetical protein